MNYKITSGSPEVIFLCHPERKECHPERSEGSK